MTNTIDHEIKLAAPAAACLRALTATDALRTWYTPDTDGDASVGGTLRFAFDGRPTFRWLVLDAGPRRVHWRCTEGPGASVGTEVVFVLTPTADDRTLLEFVHSGWPEQAANFRKCNTLWALLLGSLKTYVESGVAAPALA
ncbi:MAG: SRPBCC domain-containing protein [Chloroflexi bacterium]|nr:SRPBCC domain-containing protein [Chloroflexota bacterium]MBV9601950.1 SRPBCC domain-containing protein [Chloroflexota bacterium]